MFPCCAGVVGGPLGHEPPAEMASKYIELLLDDSGETALFGPAAQFTNSIGHHNLQFCTCKQLEMIGVFGGLCNMARDDWTVVKKALTDAPGAVDSLFQFVTQTPFLGDQDPDHWDEHKWCIDEHKLTPTPPQSGPAYVRAMEHGALSLAAQLLGSRCSALVSAMEKSRFFKPTLDRLVLLVLHSADDGLGDLPMIALDGLLACGHGLAVYRALGGVDADELDDSLEILAEDFPESEEMVDRILELIAGDEASARSWVSVDKENNKFCDHCGEDSRMLHKMKLSKCGQCMGAAYCSKACQKIAWKAHKSECGKKPHDVLGSQSQSVGKPVKKPTRKKVSCAALSEAGPTAKRTDSSAKLAHLKGDGLEEMSLMELINEIDEINDSVCEGDYEEWDLVETMTRSNKSAEKVLIERIRHINSGKGVLD